MAKITINAVGDQCPIPVVKANKAITEMREPGVVEISVDNDTAVGNLSRLAASQGFQAQTEQKSENLYVVTINVDKPLEETMTVACQTVTMGPTVAVIDSDTMGRGNEELGKILMKGFIFALSKLEALPKTVLFYNGGARLTCEGSESLEDLKSMEEQGVEIFTCGTCLDFYGLKDKLAVGSVTNMYTIVEKMDQAGKVIRP